MIEVLRRLGYAARFVTGYLYSPKRDRPDGRRPGHQGAGATHAWCEVFLPSLGWVEFDPTNGLMESPDLIRVASTRMPEPPISGCRHRRRSALLRHVGEGRGAHMVREPSPGMAAAWSPTPEGRRGDFGTIGHARRFWGFTCAVPRRGHTIRLEEREMAMNTGFQQQQPFARTAAVCRSAPSPQHAATRLNITRRRRRDPPPASASRRKKRASSPASGALRPDRPRPKSGG